MKAYSNIAFIKYWGKRDEELILPFNNSISITVDCFYTETKIEKNDIDILILNDKNYSKGSKEFDQVLRILDIVRKKYEIKNFFKIESKNNFPTAAGLASSASGFAALVLELDDKLNLKLDKKQLSILARLGSGSASRSIFKGFVEWEKGKKKDGSDSYSNQLYNENYWPEFRIIFCITSNKEKKIKSRIGMKQTVETSPMYESWLKFIEQDLKDMKQGLKNKDFTKVGKTAELNCLKMNATMWTTIPSIIYQNKITIKIMNQVKKLREQGIECYFTMDAGPQVKILCLEKNVQKIIKEIESENEIETVIGKT